MAEKTPTVEDVAKDLLWDAVPDAQKTIWLLAAVVKTGADFFAKIVEAISETTDGKDS